MLGAGLIRCRDEDVVATRCRRELDGPNMSAGILGYCRTHETGTVTHLTHGAASPALLSRPVLPSFVPTKTLENTKERVCYVMKL